MKKRKLLGYAIIALIIAAVCTYITYPGVYYSDSYTRWYTVENIISGTKENLNNGLSVFPQYIMAFIYKLSGEYGMFTFVQASAFYFTTFLVVDRISAKCRWLWVVLFTACPLFYGFSVYLEMATGVVIGVNIFILMVMETENTMKKGNFLKKILLFSGYTASYFIIFGFRQNALTLFPVMIAATAVVTSSFGRKKQIMSCIIQCVLMFAVAVFLVKIPHIAGYGEIYDLTVKGTMWDVAKTLEKVWDNEEYHDYFDFIGEGATKTIVERNHHRSIWGYSGVIDIDCGNDDLVYAINRRFLKLIVKEPKAFIRAKWQTIMNIMGVIQPLDEMEYEYDWNNLGLIDKYGVRHSTAREKFISSYKDFQAAFPVFRTPYIIYISVLLLIAVFYSRIEKEKLYIAVLLFFGACFYYGAFFITAQSHEFRYFFPAFYMLCLAAITVISNLNFKRNKQ